MGTEETSPRTPGTTLLFKRIVVIATAIGFGAVFGSLACLGQTPGAGLDFRWHWAAVPWFAVGAAGACYFWRLVWRAEANPSQKARARLTRYSILVIAAGLGAFVYPIRFVPNENFRDVLIGLAAAAVVLAFVGWMLVHLIRIFERGPKDQ